MATTRKIVFGETKEKDSQGIYGTRSCQWSIKLDKLAANGKPLMNIRQQSLGKSLK